MARLAPVISFAHGGGPMPLLGDPGHRDITRSLKTKVPEVLKIGTPNAPKAIIIVTAHWSTDKVTISSADKHSILYDYDGFPPESYEFKHNAPGSPEVAGEVEKVFKEAGIPYQKDHERGWDHGVFIPMILVEPPAKIPIVQVSVLLSEDAAQTYAIGQALGKLRAQNIAIIGSGASSFHNPNIMFNPDFKGQTTEFCTYMTDAAMTADDDTRAKKFADWRNWPHAYAMHPEKSAEHFLPLIVAAGAAGTSPGKLYTDYYEGLGMWSYYWDEE